MMDVKQLQSQYIHFSSSLFKEGILDDQFQQLRQLQDESTPGFVSEVISLFFDDSQKIINELAKALAQPIVNYSAIAANVHQLKGSSSSVGAMRVKDICVTFRNSCEAQNFEGCLGAVRELKQEYTLVKRKLQYLFDLEQKILAAGGSVPV